MTRYPDSTKSTVNKLFFTIFVLFIHDVEIFLYLRHVEILIGYKMTDIEEKKIETPENDTPKRRHVWVWIAVGLALVAWAVLAWADGYVAMAVAAAGIAAGFIGAHKNSAAMKRLATTAIIASTVLLTVVAAYLIVLKIGLS